jgi:hypothetical protein
MTPPAIAPRLRDEDTALTGRDSGGGVIGLPLPVLVGLPDVVEAGEVGEEVAATTHEVLAPSETRKVVEFFTKEEESNVARMMYHPGGTLTVGHVYVNFPESMLSVVITSVMAAKARRLRRPSVCGVNDAERVDKTDDG